MQTQSKKTKFLSPPSSLLLLLKQVSRSLRIKFSKFFYLSEILDFIQVVISIFFFFSFLKNKIVSKFFVGFTETSMRRSLIASKITFAQFKIIFCEAFIAWLEDENRKIIANQLNSIFFFFGSHSFVELFNFFIKSVPLLIHRFKKSASLPWKHVLLKFFPKKMRSVIKIPAFSKFSQIKRKLFSLDFIHRINAINPIIFSGSRCSGVARLFGRRTRHILKTYSVKFSYRYDAKTGRNWESWKIRFWNLTEQMAFAVERVQLPLKSLADAAFENRRNQRKIYIWQANII